jgi:hypothetical protein
MNRTALYSVLIAAAFSTAVATATAIPTVSALAQNAAPLADCAACVQAVSPTMQALVHNFVMASIRRDALEVSEDTEALGIAIQERHKTLVALAFQPPVNVMELAAKLAVLTEYSEDVERWSIRAAAQDAARLAEGQ